jgi:hemerythrin
MAFMQWNESYSVGVKAIDVQHQNLFNMVNDLHAAMMRQEGKTAAGALLAKLAKYTQEHFAAEEKMMEAAKYPKLAQHRALHHELTKQVQEFMARHQRGESGLSIRLLQFLGDWLTKHIQQEDKAYSACLNQSGVH